MGTEDEHATPHRRGPGPTRTREAEKASADPTPDETAAPSMDEPKHSSATPTLLPAVRRLAAAAGGVALLIGAAALLGWAGEVETLRRGLPRLPRVAPNTGLGIALAGSSILLLLPQRLGLVERSRRPRRLLGRMLALVVFVLGALTVVEYATGWDLLLDRVLFGAVDVPSHIPGRMAANTAVALMFVGLALALVDVRHDGPVRPSEVLALLVVLVASPPLAGYAYGAAASDRGPDVIPALAMALPTAMGLVALGIGVLALRPARGLMALVTSDLQGGIVARRIVAAALAVPILGILATAGHEAGLYDEATATALVATLGFFSLVTLAFGSAASLNRGDLERQRAAEAQREAAEKLRRSEQRARDLFELAVDGIFVADLDGRYTEVNARGASLLGFTPPELIGKTIMDLIPPEDAARLAVDREGMLAGGESVAEWRLRKRDGTWLPVEVSAKILPDGRWQGFVRDISARKRAEEELARTRDDEAQARAWLSAVLEQMPEGVVILRADGSAIVNRAAHRYAHAQPMGTDRWGNPTIFDIRKVSGDPAVVEDLPVTRAFLGREAVQAQELVVVTEDGAPIPILASAAPVTDEQGNFIGAVATFRDIQALKELERLREEWTSVIAHDLRQPLAVINLSAEAVLRRIPPEDEGGRRHIQRVRGAARSMSRMIDDLLDASRIEVRRMRLEPVVTDVAALVHEVVERNRDVLAHPMCVAEHAPPGTALVDPGRIEQVLTNLISNAAKYGAAGADILVEVDRHGEQIELAVTNAGPAIPASVLPHLFERFRRAPAARGRGLGLGLYIVKGLVEAHGGRVSVESVPGRTTFRVSLPVGLSAPAPQPPAAAPAG